MWRLLCFLASAAMVAPTSGVLTSEEEALLQNLLAKQNARSSTNPTISPNPGPGSAASAGEVEMYEAGGTLVIKTPGSQGDVVINGKRVAAALEGLQQAHAEMVARVGVVESENVKLVGLETQLDACSANSDKMNATAAALATVVAEQASAIVAVQNNGSATEQKLRTALAEAAALRKNVSGLEETVAVLLHQRVTSGDLRIDLGGDDDVKAFAALFKGAATHTGSISVLCTPVGQSVAAEPCDARRASMILGGVKTVLGQLSVDRNVVGDFELAGLERAGNLNFNEAKKLASVSMPRLERVVGNFDFYIGGELTRITVPALASVRGRFHLRGNGELATLTVPKLETVGGFFNIIYNGKLATASFPALKSIVGGGGQNEVWSNNWNSQDKTYQKVGGTVCADVRRACKGTCTLMRWTFRSQQDPSGSC